jgi:hypothetical protein
VKFLRHNLTTLNKIQQILIKIKPTYQKNMAMTRIDSSAVAGHFSEVSCLRLRCFGFFITYYFHLLQAMARSSTEDINIQNYYPLLIKIKIWFQKSSIGGREETTAGGGVGNVGLEDVQGEESALTLSKLRTSYHNLINKHNAIWGDLLEETKWIVETKGRGSLVWCF